MAIEAGRSTLTDKAVDFLESYIVDQALPAGALLPSQGALAEQLGVSRLVIREATRTLEARGLLTTAQGKRLVVADPSSAALSHLLHLAVRRGSEGLLDLIDVRLAIEVHTARLAARPATADDIDAMEASIGAMERLRDKNANAPSLVRADLEFHFALAGAARNELLRLLL